MMQIVSPRIPHKYATPIDELSGFLNQQTGQGAFNPNNPLAQGAHPEANEANPAMNPSLPGAYNNPSNPELNPDLPGSATNSSNPEFNPNLPGAQTNPSNPMRNPSMPGAVNNPSNPEMNPNVPGSFTNPSSPMHNADYPDPSAIGRKPTDLGPDASFPPNQFMSAWRVMRGMTVPQYQRQMVELEQKYGPDEARQWQPVGDVWRVHKNDIQERHLDSLGEGYYVPHHVPAELHEPGDEQIWDFYGPKTADNTTMDSRNFPDPTEPRASSPPTPIGCTCEEGHKLDCPVHGMHAVEPDLDHSWHVPEGTPVGHPDAGPKTWQQAYSSWHLLGDVAVEIDEDEDHKQRQLHSRNYREARICDDNALKNKRTSPGEGELQMSVHEPKIAQGPLLYSCPSCQAPMYRNGYSGFTNLYPEEPDPRMQYGHSTWDCDKCELDLRPGDQRPHPAHENYVLQNAPRQPWRPMTSMAADPYWLDHYMERNGPYLYHHTDPENAPSILERGLLPWDTEGIGTRYPDLQGGNFLQPRPNHVYLKHLPSRINDLDPEAHKSSPGVMRVDLRKLDPSHLNPDEDSLVDEQSAKTFGYEPPNQVSNGPGTPLQSWGDWAQQNDLSDPAMTAWSIEHEPGTIAYDGPIPPEAIDYPHEQFPSRGLLTTGSEDMSEIKKMISDLTARLSKAESTEPKAEPEEKRPRKLVINRDENGRMASIEEV